MSNLAVLYEPEWQKLRVSLLAEYQKDGGWTTLEGTVDNIKKLNEYVEETLDASRDDSLTVAELDVLIMLHALRVYRCLNLLNAVRMGYSGQGLKGSPQDDLVRRTRESYSYDHSKSSRLVSRVAERWNWSTVSEQLTEMRDSDRLWFDRIYYNLLGRLTTAEKRRGERKDVADTRKDLVTFVGLMEDLR